MKITLRAAVDEDAERTAEILISTRREFMPYAPSAHSDAEVRTWVRTELVPSGGVTVAECGGSVIGIMATSGAGGCSWVNQMSVASDYVSNGIWKRAAYACLGHFTASDSPVYIPSKQQSAVVLRTARFCSYRIHRW